MVLGSSVLAWLTLTTVTYRSAYGTWWQRPQRIPYCGRTFVKGASGLTMAQTRQFESQAVFPGDKPYPLVSIGNAPPLFGATLLAALTPDYQRAKLGVPCTMGLYLENADDSYTAYGLSGGP